DAADGELLVASAHNGLSHPFAAAIVVDGVDIITTSPRRTPCTPGIGPPCCAWHFFSHASCTGFSNVHPDRIFRFRDCAADDPHESLQRLHPEDKSLH